MPTHNRTTLPILYREYHFSEDFPILFMQGKHRTEQVDFLHFHNCVELAFCEQGNMVWYLENEQCEICAGSILFLPPFYTHASFFPKTNDQEVCCHYLFFNPEELLKPFYPNGLPKELLWYHNADFSKLLWENPTFKELELLQLLIKELTEEKEYCPQTVCGLMEALLVLLYRRYGERLSDTSQNNELPQRLLPRLFPAISYLDKEYVRDADTAQLAQLCGLSRTQFLKYFQICFHQTPKQYLRILRIRKACLALTKTEDGILQIALQTGFQSLSGFNHAFREVMGKSPLTYRNEKRGMIKLAPKYTPYSPG